MKPLNQLDTPVARALEEQRVNRLAHFDVPGHKGGRMNPALNDYFGAKLMSLDVNSMKPLDNLCHPISVIKEAEALAADAFGAAHAFLMVGGTTSAVQTMVLTACKAGEKIILPRNVHRSVINALVVNGATPIYVNPETDKRLGIALGMKISQVEKAIEENPDAVAILVNNPTYYGICSNLRKIVEIAHQHNMLVLVDEAHGTHFYFGENMPVTAMAAGADMSSVSMHKSGGSLTQSSFLLTGPAVSPGYVRQVINLTQTTSASYLLLASLDISRRNLALAGREYFAEVEKIAAYARAEINKIGGYYAYGEELINGDSVFDFDTTKLSVNTRSIGLAGIDKEDMYFRFVCEGSHLVFDTADNYTEVVYPTPAAIGAEDNSTGWWSEFTDNIKVEPFHTVVSKFTNYTCGLNNWNNFCVILNGIELNEYCVVRADNFGWGAGYDGNEELVHEGTQGDWATWLAAMDGAQVTVSIYNDGNGNANIDCEMVGNDGVTYTQFYHNIKVNADDLYFRYVVDGSHMVFDQPAAARRRGRK